MAKFLHFCNSKCFCLEFREVLPMKNANGFEAVLGDDFGSFWTRRLGDGLLQNCGKESEG